MAGKTFRGLGEDEDPSPAQSSEAAADFDEDQQDARGDHSSPTIVDDAKVEAILKKLRALDSAAAGSAQVTQVVDEDATARNEDAVGLAQRSTSIGRSPSTPTDAQSITIPADAARGTMFGRSIHLPEINAPEDMSIELSSGSVEYLDGAPPPSQPFPLADRPVDPSGGYASADSDAQPTRALTPFRAPRADGYEDRSYGSDPRTDFVGGLRPKRSGPFIALAGGLALVGAGWFGWTQLRGKGAERSAGSRSSIALQAPAPAPVASPTPTAPAIAPLPNPGTTAAAPAPPPVAPAAAPAPIPAATPPPAVLPTAADEPSPAPRAIAENAPAPGRRARTRHERHAAPAVTPAEGSSSAGEKPSRSNRPTGGPDDPDDTLPPSQ